MTRQVRAVQTERGLLSDVSLRAHPFVVSLLKTFQDQRRVYMLLELLPGGELWTVKAHTHKAHIPRERNHKLSAEWVCSSPSL
jgi:serine/threonine protein kinase